MSTNCTHCNGTGVEPQADGIECRLCKKSGILGISAQDILESMGDMAFAIGDGLGTVAECTGDVLGTVGECAGDILGAAFD